MKLYASESELQRVLEKEKKRIRKDMSIYFRCYSLAGAKVRPKDSSPTKKIGRSWPHFWGESVIQFQPRSIEDSSLSPKPW